MSPYFSKLRGSARSFLVAHPLLSVCVAIAIAWTVWNFGAAIKDTIVQAIEDHRVASQLKAADKAKEEARQQIQKADAAAVDRKAEDQRRETEITPAITRANEDLQAARQRRRKAEIDYEKSKLPVTDSDIRALHERNCADLRQLYPGERIAFCGDQ